jgi:hypothetical protein
MTSVLSTTALFAHKQHVHQYFVKEAYALLKQTCGHDISRMQDHIGGLEAYYSGDSAWQRPYVTTGAWREDDEDLIFGYSNYEGIPNYALNSITHFWDADNGDMTTNYFRVRPVTYVPAFNIGPYENAYDKFKRFVDGGWIINYPRGMTAQNPSNGHQLFLIPSIVPNEGGITVSYNTLTGFFHTRRLNLLSANSYYIFDLTDIKTIEQSEVPEILLPESEPALDNIVWEVLGRMCHLLEDMSLPAHVHRDEHGLDLDPLEEWIGGSEHPYLIWDHQNVGTMVDPYTSDNDPVHYLMYTMQEQADHFGSYGPYDGDGNDDIIGNPRLSETAFLSPILLSSLGQPTSMAGPWTTPYLENMRDKLIPYAIRATAGLLYWFAVETGLSAPVSVRPVNNSGMTGSFTLFQNYPNPCNPTTKIKFQIPHTAYVILHVYDVLGRVVATLVSGQLTAGEHETEFSGEHLSGGVYFYRLQSGTTTLTKRMVMLK